MTGEFKRTYPSRALAFKDSCEYACALQGYRRRHRLIDCGCWVASAILMGGFVYLIYG